MKKKLIATVMAATMAVTALTGCGSSSASSAKKDIKVPTKPFGDTVKYDPSVEINDGKDISIDMWEWGSDELFQKIIDRYTAIHPNVTINLVDNPWEDYWTKLPLALDGENRWHSSMYITAIMRILSTIWLRLIFLLRIWSRTSME